MAIRSKDRNEEIPPAMEHSPSHIRSKTGAGRAPSVLTLLEQAFLARLRTVALESRGSLLLETVVAIIVFALIGTTVLVGVSTARRSGELVDTQSIAENVARNQMEYLFSRAYKAPPLSYASIADLPDNDFNVPSGFTVTATAILRSGIVDPDIETVRVTVSHLGEQVLVLESIRGRN